MEAYAQQFDACFGTLAQRRAVRAHLQGLLLPRDRNKTLTAPAVDARRLELLLGHPASRRGAVSCWSPPRAGAGRAGCAPGRR